MNQSRQSWRLPRLPIWRMSGMPSDLEYSTVVAQHVVDLCTSLRYPGRFVFACCRHRQGSLPPPGGKMLPVPYMIRCFGMESTCRSLHVGRVFVPLKHTPTVASMWEHRFILASKENIAGKELRRRVGELFRSRSLAPSPGKGDLFNRLLSVHHGKTVSMWSGRGLQTPHGDETGSKDFGSSLRGC
jgi:hypothetical protein